jgi:putative ABC transport system substrate-binding protein
MKRRDVAATVVTRSITSHAYQMTTRREALILVGVGAVAGPFSSLAQQPTENTPRIGFLARTSAATIEPLLNSFRQGLRDLGWIDGKSIRIEYQFGDGQLNRLGELASELVRRKVDVIVTVDTPPTQAAQRATSTIPIVIAVSADPVGAGLVASLAHPGGNITGLSLLAPETDQKSLEILKETLPTARRVAMAWDPNNRGMTLRLIAIKTAALKLEMTIQAIAAPGPAELAGELAAAAKDPPDALIVLSPIYAAHRDEIVSFAAKTGVPLTFDTRNLAQEPGALLSYGVDLALLFERAAGYVDKILKGAKPADLPVEQPTKFELVINLKTARALGLTIPPSIIARADEVIE